MDTKSYKEKLKDITTFMFDIDGVLTDGNVWIYKGDMIRNLNSKDAYAIQYCVKRSYQVFVISGGHSEELSQKLLTLGVKEVFLKSKNKILVYEQIKEKYALTDEEIIYIGDDIPDFHVMNRVKIAVCPNDAASEIKEIAHYHSPFDGGRGCVRDVIEQTLKAQGNWLKDEAFEW